MEGELSIEVEDGGMNNSIAEEVKKDEGGPLPGVSKDETDSEEEIWRGRREIMNNALAASAGEQDPAKVYEYARKLKRVIEGGKVDEFVSMINVNDPLLRDIDWSAILNSRFEFNESLLHVAAENKKDDILILLVDYVGDHLITAQDDWGYTPLHFVARLGGSIGVAEMLIHKARGLPNVEDKNLLRMKDKRGDTALQLAVRQGHANSVRYLLSEDLEPVYWKNASEKSPLYLALDINDSAIHETLFSLSLEPSRIEGLPPIHGAIVRGRLDLFDLILKKNMKLFAMTDSNGGNVFHLAAHLNHAWVLEFLRPETEYLIQERDMNGDLPIHIASKMGYVEHIKKLRKTAGRANGQGQHILHIAAKYGRVSVVRYILSDPILRILLNTKDDDGNTALHLAAMHSQPTALIDLLQTDGILPSIFNNECLLAVDIARRRHKAEGYNIRHQLTYLALLCSPGGKGPLGNQELLLLRAKARDKELSVVRSRKSMPSRDIIKDYINSRMVVATLVATVTFAAGFAVPGGFNSSDKASKDDLGMAMMLDNRMFQAFAICNTIAMFCSMTVVVNLIWAQVVDVDAAVAAFERTTLPLQIALPAMSTAFLTGVTLTIGKLPWLANTIFYLGLVFLLIISFANLLGEPLIFKILGHPLRRLTFWLILAYIYLWRVGTYIYDDDDAKDNRREKKTFASPPVDVAGESRTDDSAKAKCEDALHPPGH